MELLASCSLSQAKGFNGKLVIPNEDSKRPDKVFLNIEYDDESDGTTSDFFKAVSGLGTGLVRCVSFPVGYAGVVVPEEWKGRAFVYTDLDTVALDPNYPESEGVVSLVRLDADFPCEKYKVTLRDLVSLCREHPSVRVMGGNLLGVEGLRVGRFDTGKEKMSPVFRDIYDTFVEVRLDDLEGLTEIVKKTRKKAEGSEGRVRTPKVVKPKKSKRQVEAFKSLFGEEEVEF